MTLRNEIENLIPYISDNDFGIPLRGVSKDKGSFIVIAFTMMNEISFAIYDEYLNTEIEPLLLEDVVPNCKIC